MRSIFGLEMRELPSELGSKWCWEPLKIESRCYIQVDAVEKKLDDNWWVLCLALTDGGGITKGTRVWNELSRFIEATVLIEPAQ